MEETSKPNRRTEGSAFEDMALAYLLERGYRLVKRNFRLGRMGEVDLIMRDGPVYVFIEVKARRSHGYGLPEEAVTPAKRQQVRKVATGFVYINKLGEYQARFDVVAIDYVTGSGGKPEIRHYINAF